jgi:hypothetical protein
LNTWWFAVMDSERNKQINNTFDHQEFVLQKSYVIGQVSFSGKGIEIELKDSWKERKKIKISYVIGKRN